MRNKHEPGSTNWKTADLNQSIVLRLRRIYAWMEAFLVKIQIDEVRREDYGEGPIGEILYQMDLEEQETKKQKMGAA